jgi:hypothetical protein
MLESKGAMSTSRMVSRQSAVDQRGKESVVAHASG